MSKWVFVILRFLIIFSTSIAVTGDRKKEFGLGVPWKIIASEVGGIFEAKLSPTVAKKSLNLSTVFF